MKNLLINRAFVAKKKLFTFFLALAASVGTMFAESGTCGENLTWNLTDSVLTISGTGAMNDYSSSGSSKAKWYEYRYSIKSVIIGNGVTSIGNSAFNGCTNLTSIEIPNSVTSIGNSAFNGCTNLTSIEIPNSVTSIGYEAFEDCTGLTSVEIPNSVTSVGYNAFYGCTGLISPVYNASIFACLPISYSGAYTIPEGIESIASCAFFECSSLTSVTIPNSVTSIGTWAFRRCRGLTSIEIPNSVTRIEDTAFEECSGLTSFSFPNSVTTIEAYVLCACTSLNSVTIPSSVTNIREFAFAGCTSLTSVEIPNSVTSIGDGAFQSCNSLTSIEISDKVTNIGIHPFLQSTGLMSINVDKDNPNYCSQDGILFNKNGTTLIQYPGGKQGKYTIPNSVTSIGEYAFADCRGLTSITIPNSVTSIGEWAFYYCTGLTSVTCGATMPPAIGENAFAYVNYSTIPLYVPTQSISAYKAADQWKDFNPIRPIGYTEYTITFVNWDDSVLLELPIEEGVIPEYTGATPTRPADEDYTYTFSGWAPDIVAANQDTTYIAQYMTIPIGQDTIATEETEEDVYVNATPTEEGSVILEWPAVENADTYTITIAKNGEIICTLVFDDEGRLISIAFGAPTRDGNGRNVPAAEKAAKGWRYEVKGLEPDTEYAYTVMAKQNETVLFSETLDFTMPAPQGIDDVESGVKVPKLLRDNQVLILRGDKTYTLTGQEVK